LASSCFSRANIHTGTVSFIHPNPPDLVVETEHQISPEHVAVDPLVVLDLAGIAAADLDLNIVNG